MARRQSRKESDFDALLKAPWHVSAGFALALLLASQLVIPLVFGANRFAAILIPAVKTFGFYVSIGLGLIALGLYFKQRPKSDANYPSPQRKSYPDPSPATFLPSIDATDKAWDESLAESVSKITPDTPPPTEWSGELLRKIEWKRVEELVAAYFREKTFRTETLAAGADGGIDVKLFFKDKAAPYAIVQCKAWNTQKVGVKPVRELLGVMTHEKASKGIFVTTSDFTQEAIAFAKENPINLITGDMLLKGILALQKNAQDRLLAVATEGDYTTPTCASCGIKLVRRESKNGNFWGCRNFPRCRTRIFSG